jgi:hypothetical protein
MTACDDCFQEFLHPIVNESMEKNERFAERYGKFDCYYWDSDAAVLTFSNAGEAKLRIDVSIVGTTEGNSWEWSWANSNIRTHSKLDMEKVREFGETNGYEQLSTRFLTADEYTGWEMTAVAGHVLDALGAYRFPTDHGFCYLIYRKIEETAQGKGDELFGAMRGTVKVPAGVDLTEPTGEVWEADCGESSGLQTP